jgi:hypothetical protein
MGHCSFLPVTAPVGNCHSGGKAISDSIDAPPCGIADFAFQRRTGAHNRICHRGSQRARDTLQGARGRPHFSGCQLSLQAFKARSRCMFGGFRSLSAADLYHVQQFFPLIVYRGYTGSTSPPGHSSPWILLPSETAVFYLKPLISFAALASCVFAWVKKKIDLLNLLAATLVIFVCLWITTGSMDRMNIAMIFALMCLATLSLDLWLKLAIANTLVQVATYVVGLGLFETSMRHLSFVTRWVPFSSLCHICTQFFISSR